MYKSVSIILLISFSNVSTLSEMSVRNIYLLQVSAENVISNMK